MLERFSIEILQLISQASQSWRLSPFSFPYLRLVLEINHRGRKAHPVAGDMTTLSQPYAIVPGKRSVPTDAPDVAFGQATQVYGGRVDDRPSDETRLAHRQANAELVEILAGHLRAAGVALPDEHRTPGSVLEAPNEESGLAAALIP